MFSDGSSERVKDLKQYQRHAQIIDRLEKGESLAISALADEMKVATKTLQRDFKKVAEMLPGFVKRADDGKSFVKNRNFKTLNDEALVLDMLESMAQSIGGGFYTKAHHLLSQMRGNLASPYYMSVGIEDISGYFETIKQLEEAIGAQLEIGFEYQNVAGEKKNYSRVQPLKIVTFEGFWYLLTLHDESYKKFYLKELLHVRLTDEQFSIKKNVSEAMENAIGIWFEPANEPFEVILWADVKIVSYFERRPISKSQKLYRESDGSAEIVLKVTHEEEVLPLLKYWLPYLRVLEPLSIKHKMMSLILEYKEI